jgi:hypothetical protein
VGAVGAALVLPLVVFSGYSSKSMAFRRLARGGALLASLLALPATVHAADAATTRVLLMVDAPAVPAADAAALTRGLRAALGSRRVVRALGLPEVTGELSSHPSVVARHVGLNTARDEVEEALRRYRGFDYEGALAMFEKARGTCLLAAPVSSCRAVLVTSYVHEAMALLGRDGALGAAGITAVGAAAAIAPDEELRPDEVRPEILAAFAAAREAKLVSVKLDAPGAGFVVVDGRTRVELPAREVWLTAGIHYFELFRLGAARTTLRTSVPRATAVRLEAAASEPASAVADLVEALGAGAVPRTPADAAVIAGAALLDEVVAVRAEPAPGGKGVHVLTSVLWGAVGDGPVPAAAPAPLVLESPSASPGEEWARALAGPPDAGAPPVGGLGEGFAAGEPRGHVVPVWVWGVTGAVTALGTLVGIAAIFWPFNADVYWGAPPR